MAAHRAVRTRSLPTRILQATALALAGFVGLIALAFGCQAIATHTDPPPAGVVATPATSAEPTPTPPPVPTVYHITLTATGTGPFSVSYGVVPHLTQPMTLVRPSWSTTMDVRPSQLRSLTLSVVDLGRSAYSDPTVTCRISAQGIDRASNHATGPYAITDCLLLGSPAGDA